jgi:glycosyltransferase involved in cell wall biosynthesis
VARRSGEVRERGHRPAAGTGVRVGIDGRSLRASADRRGVARYLGSLLPALAGARPDDSFTVLVPGNPDPRLARLVARPNIVVRSTLVDSRPLFATAALTRRPRVDRMVGGCDVLWAPAVAPLAMSGDVPLVLTVHDLSFEHRAGDFSRYERLWHRIARPRRLAERADRVIAVSEEVRRQLIAEWGLHSQKVVTVASGPGRGLPVTDGGAAPQPPAERGNDFAAGLEPGYVLAVGALEPRKHPDLLVEAHARARAAGLRADLVFAGDGSLRRRLAGSGATVLGHVPDEQLVPLYRNALALTCVSREEGFAFTPLEALAVGTPAVVSDLPVFAETLGPGALRVPPGDIDALAGALLRLERDRELRAELVEAGRAAAGRLSWSQAAAGTRAVLAEAAEARR